MTWLWWVLLAVAFITLLVTLLMVEAHSAYQTARHRRTTEINDAMKRHPSGKDLDND